MNPIFQQTEMRFHALRAQVSSGQISAEQFQAALAALVVQDEAGGTWTLDPNSGGWLRAVQGGWQPANPYETQTGTPYLPAGQPGQGSAVQRKRSQSGAKKVGCGCAAALLAVLLLCMLCAAAGYLASRRGWISTRTIFTLLGHGPGDVQITNLSSQSLLISAEMLDEGKYGYSAATPVYLDPGDIGSYSLEPSRYTLKFQTDNGDVMAACTLPIQSGDAYTLMAQGDEIYILRDGEADAAGISIRTSGFCLPVEAP